MSSQEPTDLDWVQLRHELTVKHPTESTGEKFNRKFNNNPFVPIGCLATVAALSYGLWSFRNRNLRMSNLMMRYRIIAQAFTVTAIVTGVIMSASKTSGNKHQD